MVKRKDLIISYQTYASLFVIPTQVDCDKFKHTIEFAYMDVQFYETPNGQNLPRNVLPIAGVTLFIIKKGWYGSMLISVV